MIEHDANAVEFVGNRTECALLMLLRGWGISYEALRKDHTSELLRVYNFSSERKMASVILKTPTSFRLYNKVGILGFYWAYHNMELDSMQHRPKASNSLTLFTL